MSAFTRLAEAVCARPRAVAAAMAIGALAAGLYGANVAERLLAGGIDVPGSESDRAAKRLTERLGIVSGDVVAMLHSPDGDVRDPEYVSTVLDGLERLYEDEAVLGALTSLRHRARRARLARRPPHDRADRSRGQRCREKVQQDAAARRARSCAARRDLPGRGDQRPDPGRGARAGDRRARRRRGRDVRAAARAAAHAVFFRSVVAALLPIAIGAFAMALLGRDDPAVVELHRDLGLLAERLRVSRARAVDRLRAADRAALPRGDAAQREPRRGGRAHARHRGARGLGVGPHRDGEHGACCSWCRCRSCAAWRSAGSSRWRTRCSARSCCCPRCSPGSGPT